MTRAAIYIRQSKEKGDSISTDVQRDACMAVVNAEGWTVAGEYLDIGQSSYTKHWSKRKAFPQLVEDVKAGHVDVVLIYRWSRLSRKATDALVLWDMLEADGARVESAAERMDTRTAAGRLGARQMLMFAAFESELKAEQWKEAHARRVAAGLPADGGPRYGYDYDKARYSINPEEASVLRTAYRLYVDGTGWSSIARQLNEAGHRTSKGAPFSANTMQRILDSGFAAGFITVNGEHLPGSHEAILTESEWTRYQAARTARHTEGHITKPRDWYLSGIVVCGKCGSPLIFHNRQRGSMKCSQYHRNRTCEGVSVSEKLFYPMITGDLIGRAAKAVDASGSDRAHDAALNALEDVRSEIRDTDTQLGKLASGWSIGLLDDTGYRAARAEVEARITELKDRETEALREVDLTAPLDEFDRLGLLDSEASWAKTLHRVIDAITVHDDRIVLTTAAGETVIEEREGNHTPHTKRHDYSIYLDGKTHTVDLTEVGVSYETFRSGVHRAARAKGLRVSTRLNQNTITVSALS